MEETCTHKDLADLCSVSETTIKSYRRKFPGYIPVSTRGKPIRFRREAGEVCLAIRDCFAKGMSVDETLAALKARFTPQPGEPRPAPAPAPAPGGASVVSPQQLEKFFETAGRMMQGMAALATAQAKSVQRLEKVEAALESLLEIESRNGERFARLLAHFGSPSPDTPPLPTSSGDGAPAPEKVRARKIVNVRDSGGEVRSYAIEKEEPADPVRLEQPPEAFLATPIVIRTEQGEFLGMPGRLPLSGFVEALVREAEEKGVSLTRWEERGGEWTFVAEVPGGSSHALHFASTTTPRGNRVALLERLDVDGKEATPRFLQEYFRQIKDRI
ncbi:MAG: DNA-binding protein [Pseudodesulfovibrio sp.]